MNTMTGTAVVADDADGTGKLKVTFPAGPGNERWRKVILIMFCILFTILWGCLYLNKDKARKNKKGVFIPTPGSPELNLCAYLKV